MNKNCHPLSGPAGFSLAELAVVVLIVAVVSAFFLWRFVAFDSGPAGARMPLTIVTEEGVLWSPPKAGGSYALIAVLTGDPMVPGSPFVIRARSVRNCEFAPHSNPTDERITVLKGAVTVGIEAPGNKFESSRLPTGSFCQIPGTNKHFIAVEAESVLQIEGTGPAQYVCAEPHTARTQDSGSSR